MVPKKPPRPSKKRSKTTHKKRIPPLPPNKLRNTNIHKPNKNTRNKKTTKPITHLFTQTTPKNSYTFTQPSTPPKHLLNHQFISPFSTIHCKDKHVITNQNVSLPQLWQPLHPTRLFYSRKPPRLPHKNSILPRLHKPKHRTSRIHITTRDCHA